MRNKYYNDAIIGNVNLRASFNKKGEMLRLMYNKPDYKEFVDTFQEGIKVNDSAFIDLHEDVNNEYKQYYTENTNILNTEIRNTYFNLFIEQIDFVSVSKDILVKKYTFKNENTIDLNISFLSYSKLFSNINNMVGTKIENDICMQYTHDYTLCMFSKLPIIGYRLHNSAEDIKGGVLWDKDYIGIGDDSAISYELGTIKPGEIKEFELIIYINDNNNKFKFDEIIKDVEKLKKINVDKELHDTEKYWKSYVKNHDGLKIITNKEAWEKKVSNYERVKKVYTRSILLFPLLTNEKTGGISAAIEIDEGQTKCGRYAYCWPRDAVFVTKALDLLNMKDVTEKFYKIFAKETQSKNGMWEQRFYTDLRLAPCWGSQIDETASIIYGVYEHYEKTKNKEFLKQTYDMCKKAIKYLQDNKFSEGYDLWEMHEGIHLYSLAAIYAAFKTMIKIEKVLSENTDTKKLEKSAEEIKEYALDNFINEDNTFRRNNKDNKADISILGTITPFEMFDINQKEIKNTLERIDLSLRTYTGGYLRFENDNYMEGNYPWPIATLWMAMYNIKAKDRLKALTQIDFITNTATRHGFLAEQVDNDELKSKWAIGLRMVTCYVYNSFITIIE